MLKWFNRNIRVSIIVLTASILRFVNLDYSDFQGDEIKAFFLPLSGQSITDFLLVQRKGPIQFIVTFLLKIINPTYDNQFVMRFLFAFVGVLSVYYFYKLCVKILNKEIAFYAAFFFCVNGFLVAFSRIVQYQSFVIFFMIISLYMLERKKLFLGLLFWSLSFLSHYDAVFIAPLALFFIFRDVNKENLLTKIKKILLNGVVPLILVLSFYIPFAMNISDKTATYWMGRLSGEVSAKLSSSKYLFSIYQPIYVLEIYMILTLLSAVFICSYIYKSKIPKKFRIFFKGVNINKITLLFIFIWFLVPFAFMEFLVHVPGTHIYTYLIPLIIFVSIGTYSIRLLLNVLINSKFGNMVFYSGVFLIFAFILSQVYWGLADHSVEYPWENKAFLLWTLPKPSPIYHLSIFGFPYYRNWEGISNFTKMYPEVVAYSTNERKSIVRYHVPLAKNSDDAGFYIYIRNPQSFTGKILSIKAAYWSSKYKPEYELIKNNKESVKVFVMPPGTLEELIAKGY